MKRRIVEIIVITALLLALMLPFLDKPFHIDDYFYIQITKAIIKEPGKPYSFTINWGETQGSGFGDLNPPLFSYFLAPVWATWGASELPLHLVALLFVFLAILSFYFLCCELDIDPLMPTLVLLSTPFWAVGTNLMLDTPAMGLVIPAVLFFVAGVKREKLWLLILSGILFSLAVLTKYSALALFGPFFVYPFLSKKPRHIIPFAIGLAVSLLWNIYCFYIYGQPHFMNTTAISKFNIYVFLFNPFVFMMIIGMTLPYAVFIIRRDSAFYVSLMIGMGIGLFSFLLLNQGIESLINGFLVGAGVFLGLYLLIYISSHIKLKRKAWCFSILNDHIFIFMVLWIVMIIIMNLFFTPFVAFRYVVFMYPALIIIMFKYTRFSKIAAKEIYMAVGFMLTLHIALAYADLRYAQSYKNAAARLKKTYNGKTVWYLGHHGWQYYADAAGFHQWSKHTTTIKGDMVIIPRNVFKQMMTDELRDKLKNIENLTYELSWLPIRSQGKLSHAGFYGSVITYPTYALSFKPLEVVDIYEVMK
jgi:4-amino-4-deoxy-L-arabinose transferase-like glycosyltransferase